MPSFRDRVAEIVKYGPTFVQVLWVVIVFALLLAFGAGVLVGHYLW